MERIRVRARAGEWSGPDAEGPHRSSGSCRSFQRCEHHEDLHQRPETGPGDGGDHRARALGLAPKSDPSLRERNFGKAQGRPHGELKSAVSGIERNRVVDADARPEEGESLSELYIRVRAFISDLETCAPGGDVIVVTHGGVIRVAQAYCSGIAVEAMDWGPVTNASVWRLVSRPHSSVVQ